MARPSRKVVDGIETETFQAPEVTSGPVGGRVQTDKIYAKTVQLAIGVDLLGSAMSLNDRRGNELEVTPLGIRAVGLKSKRTVLIPWTNIRGIELK